MFDAETQTADLPSEKEEEEKKEFVVKKYKPNSGIPQEVLIEDDDSNDNKKQDKNDNELEDDEIIFAESKGKAVQKAEFKSQLKEDQADQVEFGDLSDNDSISEEDLKPFVYERDEFAHEVFVRNLPFDATEDGLRQFFHECGIVERVTFLTLPNGRPKGVAFIKFTDEESVRKATELDGRNFGGRVLNIEKTITKNEKNERKLQKFRQISGPESCSVFVANLSYTTDEDNLRQVFENCGKVNKIRLPLDETGKPRGFAFVDFMSSESVEQAIRMTGTKIDGRSIRVDYSVDRVPPNNPIRGSRGGFRGFRGGSHRRGSYDSRATHESRMNYENTGNYYKSGNYDNANVTKYDNRQPNFEFRGNFEKRGGSFNRGNYVSRGAYNMGNFEGRRRGYVRSNNGERIV